MMAAGASAPDRGPQWLAGLLSLVVHAAFLAFLFFGVSWQRHEPAPMMAEIWSNIPKPATTREVQAPAAEPVVPQPPQPTPPAPPPKPMPPELPTPPARSVDTPKPPVEAHAPKPAEIALEKKHQKAVEEAQKKKELAQKREKLLTEQLHQERLEALKEQRRDAQRRVEAEVQQRRAEQMAQNARAAQAALADRYKLAIIQRIRGRTEVPEDVPAGLTLEVDITILPDGGVLEPVRIVKSSGDSRYDEAVVRGILRSQPLPLPSDVALRRLFRVTHLQLHHEK